MHTKRIADALARFDELLQRKVERIPRRRAEVIDGYHMTVGGGIDGFSATRWISEATSLIENVFPPTHSMAAQWRDVVRLAREDPKHFSNDDLVDSARAVFETARTVLARDGATTLFDGVRAESAGDLLDQADALLGGGYHVAAAVLAGGALETTLRHLCDRAGITPAGDGSISKYEGAIAQERRKGREILSATDGKLVTSWGGLRNDAAHEPAKFSTSRTTDEVRLMVQGIRQFIARIAV